MNQSRSIMVRAVLAVVLMVGFYALALGSAAGLFGLAYVDATTGRYIHLKFVLICVVFGAMILWAVFPRWDRFDPPGPRLTESEHPDLFTALREVASATSQGMPVEVYLVSDMNAFVAQRGGVMGFGSRRVMGIGLPLLQLLTVTQLRAVLAHEFGHFHGGDTMLGPWIYKTRSAIGRTVTSLAEIDSFIHKPFEWYGLVFLRITQAISRRQEHCADALAGSTVGPKPLIEALTAVHGGALAYDAFFRDEYIPMVESGFRPPLTVGFNHFIEHKELRKKVTEAVDEELASGEADPYDTHPPLRERIAALSKLPTTTEQPDVRRALELLRDVPALEHRLLGFLAPADVVEALEELAWDDAVDAVFAPNWRKQVVKLGDQLAGCTPTNLFDDEDRLFYFAEHLVGQEVYDVPKALPIQFGAQCAGSAVAVALLDQGWHATAMPGAPVELHKGEHTLRPFSVHSAIAAGDTTHDEWVAACQASGIADIDLNLDARKDVATP